MEPGNTQKPLTDIQAEDISVPIVVSEELHSNNHDSHEIVKVDCETLKNKCSNINNNGPILELESEMLTKCEECGKGFKTKFWFDKHILSHSLSKSLKCDLCGKTFKRRSTLNAHLREIHSEAKRYSCTKCKYETNNQTNYKTHLKIKHFSSNENIIKCNSCNTSYFRKEDLIRHNIKVHSASRFTCDLCDKSYTSKQYLRIHRTTHKPDFRMEHQCSECGKMFPNNGFLSGHMRKKHAGLTYQCGECGKELASQTGLRDHVTQHSGVKLYKCFCGKQFATQKYLQVHTRTHTGEKPYSCKDCGRTFTQKSSLSIHNQRFHVDIKP